MVMNKWIPVTEQLPEDGIPVWVTIKGRDLIVPKEGETLEEAADRIMQERWVTTAYWCEEENGWNNPMFGCPLIVRPIAWMPIEKPEPWEN